MTDAISQLDIMARGAGLPAYSELAKLLKVAIDALSHKDASHELCDLSLEEMRNAAISTGAD